MKAPPRLTDPFAKPFFYSKRMPKGRNLVGLTVMVKWMDGQWRHASIESFAPRINKYALDYGPQLGTFWEDPSSMYMPEEHSTTSLKGEEPRPTQVYEDAELMVRDALPVFMTGTRWCVHTHPEVVGEDEGMEFQIIESSESLK